MKISIITITYNSESTLIDTIDSVLNQTYKDIEYIIVDGASTDSTLSIIHSYKDKIAKVVSEKDNGLYDALNRLSDIEEIGVFKFSENDIVRNKVISKILDKYK